MKISNLLSLASLLIVSASAIAAELNVMSAGAVEPGVHAVALAYEKDTSSHVRLKFGTGPQLKEYLSFGQSFDILIAPNALIEEQVTQSKLLLGEIGYVGKVGAGVVVRKGSSAPSIYSLDDLKQVVLAADRVVYNKASTGIYLDKLFVKMGIGDAVARKAVRYADGESVLMHIAKGSGYEIGFGAITEIKLLEEKGLQYIGPLPAEVQNYTSYLAGVRVDSPHAVEARKFLKEIATFRTNGNFQKLGLE